MSSSQPGPNGCAPYEGGSTTATVEPKVAASDVDVTFQNPAGGGNCADTPRGGVQPAGARTAIAPPAPIPAAPAVNVTVAIKV